MNSIKVCEYSRSRSFHDDLILQDQASGVRSQDQWSSGFFNPTGVVVSDDWWLMCLSTKEFSIQFMQQSFVTTAPPPTGKDYDFSAFSALL